MKIAVMQFPGTNCEYECLVSVKEVGMDGELFDGTVLLQSFLSLTDL